MPFPLARTIIGACWGLFAVVWVLAALFTKRSVYRETLAQRLRYIIPILIGWFFLFRAGRLPYPLDVRVIPHTNYLLAVAVIFSICGVALCLWARATLGRNWSGTVTLKEGHELIVRGPYRLVRHPIYTGILGLLVGTAMLQARIGALIGLLLIFVRLWIKLRQEEELMLKQFPDQYPAYQQRVKRLIPLVL